MPEENEKAENPTSEEEFIPLVKSSGQAPVQASVQAPEPAVKEAPPGALAEALARKSDELAQRLLEAEAGGAAPADDEEEEPSADLPAAEAGAVYEAGAANFPTKAEKEALAGPSIQPKKVSEINWERKLERVPFLEKLRNGCGDVWRSKFTMMLVGGFVAAILFGLDIGFRQWGYMFVHFMLVVTMARCVYLQFTTREDDDNIYKRLTGQKG